MYKVYLDRGAAKADLLQRGQPGNKLSSLVDSSEQDGDEYEDDRSLISLHRSCLASMKMPMTSTTGTVSVRGWA